MNSKKHILCYGDSNTWGYVPGSLDYSTYYLERYSELERWTGILQSTLGSEYHIIEEGLNGRTTNLDYSDRPGLNGASYFLPCLNSHAPLDLVMIQLGLNDLQVCFDREADAVASGMKELIGIAQNTLCGKDMQSQPELVVVSPPELVNENFLDENNERNLLGAMKKSKQLSQLYSRLADDSGCHFLDLAPHVTLSEIDGLHLDERGHRVCAQVYAEFIRGLL